MNTKMLIALVVTITLMAGTTACGKVEGEVLTAQASALAKVSGDHSFDPYACAFGDTVVTQGDRGEFAAPAIYCATGAPACRGQDGIFGTELGNSPVWATSAGAACGEIIYKSQGFCDYPCTTSDDCPAPLSGTAKAVCSGSEAGGTGHCALDCQSDDQCPTDFVCDQLNNQCASTFGISHGISRFEGDCTAEICQGVEELLGVAPTACDEVD